MFIGFNLGFFPMHLAGLLGMPRRIYTYVPHMGWSTVNMVTSVGSFVFAAGILIFLGCADARMGNAIAAAGLQFCGDSICRQVSVSDKTG